MSQSLEMVVTDGRYDSIEVSRWAKNLWRWCSLERAARMCGVSAGQVARWRDGAPLTDLMLCKAAIGMAASDAGMVGTFGRIDAGTGRFSARVAGDTVVVELHRPAPVSKTMPRMVNR